MRAGAAVCVFEYGEGRFTSFPTFSWYDRSALPLSAFSIQFGSSVRAASLSCSAAGRLMSGDPVMGNHKITHEMVS